MAIYIKINNYYNLTLTITWINLGNIMVTERNQLQKTTSYIIPFVIISKIANSAEIEKKISDCLLLGWGIWCANGYMVHLWSEGMF